ncbi:Dap1 protein [Saccharomycopsis crataegensis]|uniref:Dap1 protein n=1 Tax=Saccharomycopsis crataegensis TaxID=43959 RepID=A0AAV5QQC4_9ASCO|nr:Dap1 protein [Saccharomycopsis crataegensis]
MNNIVLALLVIVTGYIVKITLFPSYKQNPNLKSKGKKKPEVEKKKPIVEGSFTPRQLSQYNGHDEKEIFIAVKGTVYNASSARGFYGPSGPYSNFAGHDASRGLAKNSFEFDVIRTFEQPIDDLNDLTETEKVALDDWEALFKRKYPVVGKLVAEET